jgi:hypothetical protein
MNLAVDLLVAEIPPDQAEKWAAKRSTVRYGGHIGGT